MAKSESEKSNMPLVGRLIENKNISLPRISYEAQPSNKILKRSYLAEWASPSYILMTGNNKLCIMDKNLRMLKDSNIDLQESVINSQTINDFALITKSESGSLA